MVLAKTLEGWCSLDSTKNSMGCKTYIRKIWRSSRWMI